MFNINILGQYNTRFIPWIFSSKKVFVFNCHEAYTNVFGINWLQLQIMVLEEKTMLDLRHNENLGYLPINTNLTFIAF